MTPPRKRSGSWVPDLSDYGKPIPVEGGLRARSSRGDIGEQWWSRRFVAVLEQLTNPGRLTRGRAYARKGQVLSLDVASGTVTARVQGSEHRPYAVTIEVKPFPEMVWARLEIALAEQARFSAALLAGEMPAGIEQVAAEAGGPLFPRTANEMQMRCTCPDPTTPCKHLAATLYLLAERFDEDPFDILAWRGRPRQELLGRLRVLRGDAAPSSAAHGDGPSGGTATTVETVPADEAVEPVAVAGATPALSGVRTPGLEDMLDRYWAPPVALGTRPAVVAADVDLALRQLATPPRSLGGTDLRDALAELYQSLRKDD